MFICSAALSSIGPSQVIKELQEFYTDTYLKLKNKDEPQRETLKAIHYAVCLSSLHPQSMCPRAIAFPDQCVSILVTLVFVSLPPIPALLSAVELLWCGWRRGTIHLGHLPPKGHTLNHHSEGKHEEQDLCAPAHLLWANPIRVEVKFALSF